MLFALYDSQSLLVDAIDVGGSQIFIRGGVPRNLLFLSRSRLGLERRKPTKIMVGGGV